MANRNKPPPQPEKRTPEPPPAGTDQVPSVGPPKRVAAAQTTPTDAGPASRDAEQDPLA